MTYRIHFHAVLSLTALLMLVSPQLWARDSGDSIAACQATSISLASTTNLRRRIDTELPLPEEKADSRIARIIIERDNIFSDEEAENNFLFDFANNIHLITEPEVIRALLLFSEGDDYRIDKLEESERLLRQQKYLYDAWISAERDCHGDVDVLIVTRELWTLLPEISFGRSGGENKSSIGFRETNFLGWGKRVSVARTSDVDRNGYELIYDDPNILGSRYRGRLEVADNNDGKRHWLELTLPFYAIDTPYSYGLLSTSDWRIEKLYQRGEVYSEFKQHSDAQQIYFGRSDRLRDDWTQRLTVGYQYETDRFDDLPLTTTPLADERTLSYPYIAAQWLEDDYVKVQNFDSITRTEDLNLGWNIRTKLGYSSESISNDDSRLIYQASFSKAHYAGSNALWRFNGAVDGLWNYRTHRTENLFSSAQVQYFLNTSLEQTWYAKLRLNHAKNMTPDKQLTLGGITGLRGYPLNYQQGDRSFLFTLERRYYWEYDLFHLFKVGGAAFFDVGRAWFTDHDNGNNSGTLKNIGFGLRLAPSRANAGNIIHIDLALPLDSAEDVDSVQWVVEVKNSF